MFWLPQGGTGIDILTMFWLALCWTYRQGDTRLYILRMFWLTQGGMALYILTMFDCHKVALRCTYGQCLIDTRWHIIVHFDDVFDCHKVAQRCAFWRCFDWHKVAQCCTYGHCFYCHKVAQRCTYIWMMLWLSPGDTALDIERCFNSHLLNTSLGRRDRMVV